MATEVEWAGKVAAVVEPEEAGVEEAEEVWGTAAAVMGMVEGRADRAAEAEEARAEEVLGRVAEVRERAEAKAAGWEAEEAAEGLAVEDWAAEEQAVEVEEDWVGALAAMEAKAEATAGSEDLDMAHLYCTGLYPTSTQWQHTPG